MSSPSSPIGFVSKGSKLFSEDGLVQIGAGSPDIAVPWEGSRRARSLLCVFSRVFKFGVPGPWFLDGPPWLGFLGVIGPWLFRKGSPFNLSANMFKFSLLWPWFLEA